MRFISKLKNGFMRLSGELFNRMLFCAAIVQRFLKEQQDNRRLLLVRTDAIGDFILFSPCLAHYRELFPRHKITLLVSDSVLNLADICPYVDTVWSMDKAKFQYSWFERFRWYRKIVLQGFDIAINTVYSPHIPCPVECLVGWSIATRRIAFECLTSRKVNRNNYKLYYTELVPDSSRGVFEMDRNFSLLRYLGYLGETETQATIWTSPEDRKSVAGMLTPLGTATYAVLFPGAKEKIKIWGEKKFISTIELIARKYNLAWVVCGDKREAVLCDRIMKALKNLSINAISLAGKTSLREAAIIVKNAAIYIGNDSMGTHLSSAMGVPAVCILGGGHYGRFYPYPGNSLTLAVTHTTKCSNCDWICNQQRTECIEDITVDQVVAAMDKLLSIHLDRL